jgi:hypothetical protein
MALSHLQILLFELESVVEFSMEATPIYFDSRSRKPVLQASCHSVIGKEVRKGFHF